MNIFGAIILPTTHCISKQISNRHLIRGMSKLNSNFLSTPDLLHSQLSTSELTITSSFQLFRPQTIDRIIFDSSLSYPTTKSQRYRLYLQNVYLERDHLSSPPPRVYATTVLRQGFCYHCLIGLPASPQQSIFRVASMILLKIKSNYIAFLIKML